MSDIVHKWLYEVRDQNRDLVMIAPMKTLRAVFRLRHEGERRIERETENGGECLFFRNNAAWPEDFIHVVITRPYEDKISI